MTRGYKNIKMSFIRSIWIALKSVEDFAILEI